MCIEFKNVDLVLYKKTIIKNINTVFRKGFNLIDGNSGSGKTSLLKLISLLYTPEKGAVFYKDKDINRYDASYWRSICMLTKQITPLSEGSVMDNILLPFNFKIHKNKTFDKKLMYELFEAFNLDRDILEKSTTKLSGGEMQRVAIIRTMLLKPEIFLFDEPTSALDFDTQNSVLSYIKYISKNSICIVASHSKEALEYGDSIFKVEKGVVSNV